LKNIYEIEFDNNLNYIDIMNNIKLLGDFSIFNNYFYIVTKYSITKIKTSLDNIKNIKIINEKNYKDIKSLICKKWCYDILLNNEKIIFEQKNQKRLEIMDKDLDYLLELKKENKLEDYFKKIQTKKDGELNACEKNNNSKDGNKEKSNS
jgi:hypothetical protein